jgi:hypothetical protein
MAMPGEQADVALRHAEAVAHAVGIPTVPVLFEDEAVVLEHGEAHE